MISRVTGSFLKFDADTETYDEAFKRGKSVKFTAATDSIFTNQQDRDTHLISVEFFDVALYLQISFAGYRFQMEEGKIIGDLTVKGTTRK